MNTLHKNIKLFSILLAIALLFGCGTGETGGNKDTGGSVTIQSQSFPEIQGMVSKVVAYLEEDVAGFSCPLTVDSDTTLSGQCSGIPNGTHTYTLKYVHTDTGAILATTVVAATMEQGQNHELSFPALIKNYDDDGDGYTNIIELVNGSNPKDNKSVPSSIDTTPPATPGLLSPTAGSSTSDNTPAFDWSDVTDPSGMSYEVQVDNNSDFTSPEINQYGFAVSNYTPTTSLSDGTYYWRVRARDGSSNVASDGYPGNPSAWSTPWSITINTGNFPSAPAGVTVAAGDGQATIIWNTVTDATSYNLYWATTSGVTKSTGTRISNVTSPYTHTGRSNGTTYYYVVTAVNSYSESEISSEVSVKPETGATSPLTGDATDITVTSVALNGSLKNPSGYTTMVWFEYGTTNSYGNSTNPTTYTQSGDINVSANVTGLQEHVSYYFRIVTSNSSGTYSGNRNVFTTLMTPEVLATGLYSLADIAVDSTSVYWTESAGTVKKVDKNGGVVMTLASGLNGPSGIAVDSTSVYWTELAGTVKKVDKNGGVVMTLASGLNGPSGIAVDSISVYWLEGGSLTSNGAVKKVNKNGGTVTILASGLGSTRVGPNITLDSDTVYWTGSGGVNKVDKNGGTVATLSSDSSVGLAVDSTSVYWKGAYFVKKVGKNGGTATTLASWPCDVYCSLSVPSGNIAVDTTSGYVYFAGEGIKKVGINGGLVTTIASGSTTGITVDSTNVYWTDSLSIKKISKDLNPSAPTGLTTTAGDGQVSISWNAVSGATSYNIYWSTTSGVSKTSYEGKIPVTGSPYTYTGLTNGTKYYYVVTAVNGYGESNESSPPVSATPQAVSTSGLIAYYPFNGNANDASGNGYNGTVNGAALTADRFGNANSAYSFNGTNNYISLSNTSTLNFTSGGFTLAAWVNFTADNNDVMIIAKHISGNSSGYFLGVGHTGYPSNVFNFFVDSDIRLKTTETYNDGNWHFVSGVYDGTNQYLYVDGVLKGSQQRTYSNTNNIDITIGGLVSLDYFNGLIDDVSIYNRPLSASEVQSLYSGQASAPSAPTGVTATAGDGQATISWNAVSGATSYNIYWSTTSGVSKTSYTGKIPINTNLYTHTGLTNGTTYYYVVTAVNSYVESGGSSPPVSATPTSGVISDTTAPSNTSGSNFINSGAASTNSTNVTLTLSATDDAGVTGYCAKELSATPSVNDTCWTSIISTTSYSAGVTFTLSSGDGAKTVYVCFKDAAGNVSSVVSDSITLATIPSVPTGVTAAAGDGQATITWTAVPGATSYNIYWSTTSGVTKTNGTNIIGVTSPYTHTGRTNGTTYYYVVIAVNSSGESSESSQVSAAPSSISSTGYTWTSRVSGTTNSLLGVTWSGTMYVAVGMNGTILTSTDGTTWTIGASGTYNFYGVAYAANTYVAVGAACAGCSSIIMTSSDGTTWTSRTTSGYGLTGIAYGNNMFVAVGNFGAIQTSADGITWTTRTSGTSNHLNGIIYANNMFIAVGHNGTVLTSTDGISWTLKNTGITDQLHAVAFWNSTYVVAGQPSTGGSATMLTSTDMVTWTNRTPNGTTNLIKRMTYGNNVFIAVGGDGIFSSSDGITWTQIVTSSNYQAVGDIIWAGTQFVAVGNYGVILTGAPAILFADDFNDNSIDTNKWTYGGNVVTEASGIMKLDDTVTDQWGYIKSQWINIDPSRALTITRRTILHYANSYHRSAFYFYLDNASNWSFGISYDNYSYSGGGECAISGFYIVKNSMPAINCSPNDRSQSIQPIWDMWFDEKIVYNPATGLLEYYMNNTWQAELNVGALSPNSISLYFNADGWYTGHYQYMDDLIVAQ